MNNSLHFEPDLPEHQSLMFFQTLNLTFTPVPAQKSSFLNIFFGETGKNSPLKWYWYDIIYIKYA